MSTEPMSTGWYYQKTSTGAQQPLGPFTWEQLVSYARGGVFSQNDVVWHERLGNWLPASQVQGLFPTVPPTPQYAPRPEHTAAQVYGGPPAPRRRISPLAWAIPLAVVVLAGIFLGLYFGLWRDGDETTVSTEAAVSSSDDTVPSTDTGYVQAEGEIFLEPSGIAGPDSFAGEQFVPAGPTTTLSIPTTTLATSTTLPAGTAPGGAQPVTLVSLKGDTPALYGGSKSKQIADREGQLAFLSANPDKAAAFCAALNADPTLRWSGGTQVAPDQLPAYFADLTPMRLTRDIRVTNHGFRDGKPTPRQSVLQAGQLVLVDRYGVPRVRCECGNPLIPPKPVRGTPSYTGPRWPGFDPATVIVIEETTVIIDIFVVVDIHTGESFTRPAGTSGGQDAALPTTTSSSTSTTAAGAPVSGTELQGTWTGTLTFTEFNIPQEMSGMAEAEGCDLAMLEGLVNQPLPVTLEMTVDSSGTSGSAVMLIDASALGPSDEVSSEPLMLDFTVQGDTVTFEATDGTPMTMSGVVSRQGQNLAMTGILDISESGIGVSAEWQVSK